MARKPVQMSIPFESLLAAVAHLSLEDKQTLFQLLNEEMAQVEEEVWEQDSSVASEIQEARAAYRAGDYVTIDEYIARNTSKS
jgi:hypothetical protein